MRNVVLITGGAGDLGSAISEEFAKKGYTIVINYNNNKNKASRLKEDIEKKYNVEVLIIKADISNEEDVKNMVGQIINKFSHIDVLVNNAAVEISSDFHNKEISSFRRVFDVNVFGMFFVTKCVAEEMLKRKTGKILNISSNNAIDKYDPSTIEYDASKSAVINMTYNMAKEYAPYINVNCIAPGWIKTQKIIELDNVLQNKFIDSESKNILLDRFAEPEEIAKVILFLCSEDASYINGTVIKIDGGSK